MEALLESGYDITLDISRREGKTSVFCRVWGPLNKHGAQEMLAVGEASDLNIAIQECTNELRVLN